MLLELTGFENVDLGAVLPLAGLLLGGVFGVLAQQSKFCLRTAVIEAQTGSRFPMAGAYLIAMIIAAVLTQGLELADLITFEGTRFAQSDLALGPLLIGGALFGAGMVLTRGCASRLTVLAAQGNMRAVLVLLVFAVVAYASLRGILTLPRRSLAEATTVELGGVFPLWVGAVFLTGAAWIIWRSGVTLRLALYGGLIGIVVALGWFATGAFLADPFDPQPAESLAFTAGASDALFFVMVSSAVEASFASGVFAGVLIGAFLSAMIRKEFALESFENGPQTLRYLSGAALMGIGGVWAGGCTIGAGVTGTSAFSVAAYIALGSMIFGAMLTNWYLSSRLQPSMKKGSAEVPC